MAETKQKILVLLDTHAILHRAYHALPEFATSKGEPTGALYGLATMLLKIIADLKPDYIVACYDLPQPTYRHEVYEAYKSGRKKADDELVVQIKRSSEIFDAFGIPRYSLAGFEADDMLGSITEQMKKDPSIRIIIASGDMDTLQLVEQGRVLVYTLKKGISDTILYDEKGVKERFGFGPLLIPDYKGLRGDPSDNIIGISGIGEKTATELITQFGTLEEIYKKLKKDKEAFLKAGIKERMVKLLEEGEEEALFSKMLATIRRDAPIEFHVPEKNWKEAVDFEKTDALFKTLEFRTLGARVRSAVHGVSGGEGENNSAPAAGAEPVVEVVDPLEIKKIALALWVIDSNRTDPTQEDIMSYTGAGNFTEAREMIFAELKKRAGESVYNTIELPLIPVVESMEARGVKIDAEYLKELSKKYHVVLAGLEQNIWKQAGQEFNINSPKQLGEILFEKMGLKPLTKHIKKTAGGKQSTKESELEKLREVHPIIDEILQYREFQKLLSTYIDTIPEKLVDGRLHARFIQAGTTTGRMASSEPNLQNIPIRSELGRAIRKAFVAEKGFKLVAFDYSQIELRIAAFLSEDKDFLEIFREGRDVHTEVAAKVFNIPAGEVTSDQRSKAKTINFGILYGMGITSLQQNLKTTRAEAQKFYDDYFAAFPTLAQYMDNVKGMAQHLGYTETLFGRRRYFEGLKSHIPFIKAAAERTAINAPIQGTEADIVKIAMARIFDYIRAEKLEEKVYPILQVHDELVYEVEEKTVAKVLKDIKKIMESVVTSEQSKGVVCVAEAAVGDTWEGMEDQS
ncbi:MAG: DNA polymerase [Candidatus Paceibacterota bacterium]|jgi:DNA polymerase-1